jgi:hypothetical protein
MTLILSGTDGLSDVDGSAATPAIRGTDANTGIFFPAADTIAFSEGGTEAMRITSAGGVSFGATGTAYGTSGQVLTSQGNASPTWTTASAPVFGRVVRTSGSVSTTSTSLVDVTGASITLTTGASPVHISFAGSWYNDTDNQAIYINVDIDGSLELGTNGMFDNDTFNYEANASFSIDSAVLTAASHTFKIKFKVSAGTGVIYANTATAYNFSVHEIR